MHKKATTHKPAACAHRRARPHQKINPHKKAAAKRLPKATIGAGAVSGATWMHDLGRHLWSRKLSDIVIPGSHDTATYGLPNDPISLIGKAQDEDITAQLNDGIRELRHPREILTRRRSAAPETTTPSTGFSCLLGDLVGHLRSDRGVDELAWPRARDHLGGPVDRQERRRIPADQMERQDCQAFGSALGSALLTPSDLKAAGYSADPGQVTLGQLWAMPGNPRVILSDDTCMRTPTPAPGRGPRSPVWQRPRSELLRQPVLRRPLRRVVV